MRDSKSSERAWPRVTKSYGQNGPGKRRETHQRRYHQRLHTPLPNREAPSHLYSAGRCGQPATRESWNGSLQTLVDQQISHTPRIPPPNTTGTESAARNTPAPNANKGGGRRTWNGRMLLELWGDPLFQGLHPIRRVPTFLFWLWKLGHYQTKLPGVQGRVEARCTQY